MKSVTAVLASLGDVAQKQELIARGVTRRQLSAAVALGTAFRVRQGWYALPQADPAIVRAVRVGGRLGCVSAARYYGWATPERAGLHVCLSHNAARLRTPQDKNVRMPAADSSGATLHWCSPGPCDQATRLVTSPFETVRDVVLCQPPEYAVAALDSFLHLDPHGSALLDDWLSTLPASVLDELAERSELCHSFLESIGRIRLAASGVTGEHQVPIPGVGRVDLVIDGWLVIEWDGLEHHDNARAHDEDCRRDAELAILGYRCLRFTYKMVMHNWDLVIAAIRAALDTATVA